MELSLNPSSSIEAVLSFDLVHFVVLAVVETNSSFRVSCFMCCCFSYILFCCLLDFL
ncbi:hypothetical protein Lalb_Chr05g0223901 [Lupinus albus]|uniref:Uncharacterized protein n=1 Tax=Lupinus albus TaxID=3870 RepID=A0A6A4QJE2_LUPAL|nr:hypothetical protein Lalb_Chr05g0223901 [Lupinus albus]